MLSTLARLGLLCATVAQFLPAQETPRFTTQVLLVAPFSGSDRKAARSAAGTVRDRVGAAFSKRDFKVVSNREVREWLYQSGIDDTTTLSDGELADLAKKFRADEKLAANLKRTKTGGTERVAIEATFSMVRDASMTQPLTVEANSVDAAADSLAKEVIAVRRQVVPLRLCENANRDGKFAEGAAQAVTAVQAYQKSIPARVCLLRAIASLGGKPDSILSIARAILTMESANAAALEAMAVTLDETGKHKEAGPYWVRYLATDSTNEDKIERVVNELSRNGNPQLAASIIDSASARRPENLPFLKLRWLVHLAEEDWKGAIAAGEQLLARDPGSMYSPDFYMRLATAYRSDSQPIRALATAATGAARLPKNPLIYLTYMQLLRAENDIALSRAIASFPESGEMHAFAAQQLKSAGNAAGALEETKRALTANPRLPRGYLQLAQLELEVGQPDSALVAIEQSTENGESSASAAQFALARGNALYASAVNSQQRTAFERALKFLQLSDRLAPTQQAKFLVGATALSVSRLSVTEAVPARNCELARRANDVLVDAEMNLIGGGATSPDAAKQFLDYVGQLKPYVAAQLKTLCDGAR